MFESHRHTKAPTRARLRESWKRLAGKQKDNGPVRQLFVSECIEGGPEPVNGRQCSNGYLLWQAQTVTLFIVVVRPTHDSG